MSNFIFQDVCDRIEGVDPSNLEGQTITKVEYLVEAMQVCIHLSSGKKLVISAVTEDYGDLSVLKMVLS